MKLSILGIILVSGCLFGQGTHSTEKSACCEPKQEPKVCCEPKKDCCEDRWVFDAEFLYWQAMHQGFPLGVETTDNFTGTPTIRGPVIRIDQKWDPGFRVGLGWKTCYDLWDLQARWTYYHNQATTTQTFQVGTAGETLGLIPLWTIHAIGASYGFTSGRWYLNYNMVNFEWGREICICNYLTLRPHLGLEGGWLHQDYYAKYSDPDPTYEVRESVLTAYNNFAGVGPRIGLDGNWYLGCWGFSAFGNFATSLLYGKTKVLQKERSLSTMSVPQNVYVEGIRITDDFHQLAPHVQFILGLAWEKKFWCDQIFWRISAGWEMNYWWDQMHLVIHSARGGDYDYNKPIMLQGLTLQTKFDF